MQPEADAFPAFPRRCAPASPACSVIPVTAIYRGDESTTGKPTSPGLPRLRLHPRPRSPGWESVILPRDVTGPQHPGHHPQQRAQGFRPLPGLRGRLPRPRPGLPVLSLGPCSAYAGGQPQGRWGQGQGWGCSPRRWFPLSAPQPEEPWAQVAPYRPAQLDPGRSAEGAAMRSPDPWHRPRPCPVSPVCAFPSPGHQRPGHGRPSG